MQLTFTFVPDELLLEEAESSLTPDLVGVFNCVCRFSSDSFGGAEVEGADFAGRCFFRGLLLCGSDDLVGVFNCFCRFSSVSFGGADLAEGADFAGRCSTCSG